MFEKYLTRFTVVLFFLVCAASLIGCANATKVEQNTKKPNLYDGSISIILGCMFAPNECERLKYKQSQVEPHETEKEYLDKTSKEWEEVDNGEM